MAPIAQTRHMQHLSVVMRKAACCSKVVRDPRWGHQTWLVSGAAKQCHGCVQADARCLTEADRPWFYRHLGSS